MSRKKNEEAVWETKSHIGRIGNREYRITSFWISGQLFGFSTFFFKV